MTAKPKAVFRSLAKFMGVSVDVDRLDAATRRQTRLHPPTVVHGARLADACGAKNDAQRLLLDATRRVAAQLGYDHDGARATTADTFRVVSTLLESDSTGLDARVAAAKVLSDAKAAAKAAEAAEEAAYRKLKKRDKRRRHNSILHGLGF